MRAGAEVRHFAGTCMSAMISTSGAAPSTARAADLLALELRVFGPADLGEVGGELVILVLRPALERVVVALVAVEAHGRGTAASCSPSPRRDRAAPCSSCAAGLSTLEPLAVRMSWTNWS